MPGALLATRLPNWHLCRLACLPMEPIGPVGSLGYFRGCLWSSWLPACRLCLLACLPMEPTGPVGSLGYCLYLKFAKEIIKNSKVNLFLVENNNQLAKFIKKNMYGKKIVIGMGAGSISNWIKKLPELM